MDFKFFIVFRMNKGEEALLHFRISPFCYWWFTMKKRDLTLTVTLTLEGVRKCNSAAWNNRNLLSIIIYRLNYRSTS